MITKPLPELLAPAGSRESFEAAIAGGADAVYFGGERFSARARAKNLTLSEIDGCLRECRARGIKAYAAINTRLRGGELSDALEDAYEMLSLGTDALIVADAGLAMLLRQTFPEAQLHASTQITGTTATDAEVLEKLGFSRMVCPRELSMDEVRRLVANSPIEIEMFIHGAHCVSISGQCSMSYVMGGRSGNRGDCAGPCRLPFGAGLGKGGKGGKDAPRSAALSLKDMCLAEHICDIADSGVRSLKIEGRLKGPEYTYGVVSIYRKLLDERRNATPDETARLSEYFSRDGFSDGYIKNRYGNMLGTRKDSEVRQDKERFPVPDAVKVPAYGKLQLHSGMCASLTLTSACGSATVTGDVLTDAVGNPPTEESLRRSISKLGQTPFVLGSLEVDTDGVCGISAAALNGLRRSAACALLAPPKVVRCDAQSPKGYAAPVGHVIHTAVLTSIRQLTDSVSEYFGCIFIPMSDLLDAPPNTLPDNVGAYLPDVMYDSQTDTVSAVIKRCVSEDRAVMVHTLGELSMAVRAGTRTVCSHRFVVYNAYSAAVLKELGADTVTLSPEVGVAAAKEISGFAKTAVLTGGRMPLMLCRRCPMSDGGRNCDLTRAGGFDGKTKPSVCIGYLTDRTGARLPAVGDRYCMTTVYNSVPTWTDMKERDMLSLGIGETVYIFSAESPSECDRAVEMLKHGTAPDEYRKLR